tara:strand:- start:95 stop:841 length:747 start_codon:yes stop_codon:yes gene_type:complete
MLEKIRLIEIELFSFCNRQCSFCPNSFIDRHSDNKILNLNIFKKIINELKSINYSNYISFSRYNEPLSHRDILDDRIKYIRKHLPNVKLVMNTNGDYDWEGVDVDELTIMDYDGKLPKEKLGLFERDNKPNLVRIMRLGKINNRAGSLKIKKRFVRDFPCYEPTYFTAIDYSGNVVPCCNIRSDVDIHKDYILGNLKDSSLDEILTSNFANTFRDDVSKCNFSDVCKSCSKEPGRYTNKNPNLMNEVS